MKIYLESGGCNRRKLDLTKLEAYFVQNGHKLVGKANSAEIVIVTTCAFNEMEEEFSIKRIKSLMKKASKLIVYGCLPDISPERFAEFNGVEFVPPTELEKIDSIIKNTRINWSAVEDSNKISRQFIHGGPIQSIQRLSVEMKSSPVVGSKINNYLMKRIGGITANKRETFHLFISRGCRGACSYCAIRRAIGPLKSKSLTDIAEEIQKGLRTGHSDFNIVGDDVGAYGLDMGSSFPLLISQVKSEIERHIDEQDSHGKAREMPCVHVEGLNPKWAVKYADEICDLSEKSSFLKGITIPVQSGSERILKLMNRYPHIDKIDNAIMRIKKSSPEFKLGTHLLVGFPTETKADVDESIDFVRKIRFDEVVVFMYGEKKGTASEAILPKVLAGTVKSRIKHVEEMIKQAGIPCHFSC